MRTACISDKYCPYRTDSGYCGFTGCGCALDSALDTTITFKQPNDQPFRLVQVVDVSTESINQIADAVVKRLREVSE